METGTIIGDKAYSVQYIADAHRYSDYLLGVQNMIDFMQITSQGNGHYGISETVIGPNNITATLTAPPGSKFHNNTRKH